jgi:hypothetical protein
MEPIRVIGRVDLAQQIHAALLAEGADARLVTATAKTVAKETGRDGTSVDVLANSLDVCFAIKRAAPQRPVVIVHIDEPGTEFLARVAARGPKTSAGPDAYLAWPATAAEILGACDRARETALIPRPSYFWRLVGSGSGLVALLLVGGWAFVYVDAARGVGRAGTTTVAVASLVKGAFWVWFGWHSWSLTRTKAKSPRWRFLRPIMIATFAVNAAWALFDGLRTLLQ